MIYNKSSKSSLKCDIILGENLITVLAFLEQILPAFVSQYLHKIFYYNIFRDITAYFTLITTNSHGDVNCFYENMLKLHSDLFNLIKF